MTSEVSNVPGIGVWIGVIIIAILCVGVTVWVTNKAYSRKWDK